MDRKPGFVRSSKSYVGFFDPFAELIQNGMDAVDTRRRELDGKCRKHISVAINLKDNSITTTDWGVGFQSDQFKTFLCPNISFKDGLLSRGKKGVGATYRIRLQPSEVDDSNP